MTDQRDALPSDGARSPDEPRAKRRPYVAPELIEYGTVAKLTQTGGNTTNDAAGMMRMP